MQDIKLNPRSRFLRDEYRARINRVMDHIEKNISGDLPLESLARVANFSMFHFHRIFTAMTGEPLSRFIQRIRVEKAANLLAGSPKMSVTEIAYACGFSGSAAFARSFKEYFGMSATAWRALPEKEKSKIRKAGSKTGKTKSKGGKDIHTSFGYLEDNQSTERRNRMSKELHVAVKDLPEMPVAYVRHIGPSGQRCAL